MSSQKDTYHEFYTHLKNRVNRNSKSITKEEVETIDLIVNMINHEGNIKKHLGDPSQNNEFAVFYNKLIKEQSNHHQANLDSMELESINQIVEQLHEDMDSAE